MRQSSSCCPFSMHSFNHFQEMNFISVLCSFIVLLIQFRKEFAKDLNLTHSEACKELLENFASASAAFMFCSLENARPVRMCCSCVDQYYEVLEKHDKIAKKTQNATCNENLINEDRLEVIETGFSFIANLWSRGQCKNCFENRNALSNSTSKFIQLYADTNKCLTNHFNPKNKTYHSDVCFMCSEEYYKMSKFYGELKEALGNGNVCMDVVDAVNITQHLWSNILHCGETAMTLEMPLIAASITFIIIPIIFYLCSWKYTKDRSSAVLNQNRVSQRFQQRWRSRTACSLSNN